MEYFQSLFMDPYGVRHISFSKGQPPKREGWELLEQINLTKDEDPKDPMLLWTKLTSASKAIRLLEEKELPHG